ncbi:MAG: MutS-related protein [Ruminococcus sp.]
MGRGTSTLDGVSCPCCGRIISSRKIGCRRYLRPITTNCWIWNRRFRASKNYSVAVKKHGDSIRFLRKIVPGGVDDSYGIAVASLPDCRIKW